MGAFVLGVVACLAGLAFLSGLVGAPVLLPASVASAQGACGPVGEPCTWNFSPLGANGGGADVYAAQAAGREGAGVLVAVVDTWVDPTHPALGGRVVDEADCVGAGASGSPDPGACHDHQYTQDACDHGTHVAGSIASSNYGVAPRANILAVQTLAADSSGSCSGDPTDVAAGVLFAAQRGARVINLSVGDLLPGFTQDSNLTAAVHQAAALGALVIFAAGNNGAPISDSYGTDALLVAATGPSGQLAGYSNAGGGVSLGAPGGDDGTTCIGACLIGGSGCAPDNCILSTVPAGQYALMEGTSMAAPHVSGTAALLFGENPGRSRADAIHAIQATAHPLSGAGSGLIDAGAALALEPAGAPAGTVPPRPAPPPASTRTQRASTAGVPRSNAPSAGVPAVSSGSALPSSPTVATTTSLPTPSSVPQTLGIPPDSRSPSHRSAAAPVHGGTSGTSDSVATAGGVAALLLLLTGAGAGVFARRRRA